MKTILLAAALSIASTIPAFAGTIGTDYTAFYAFGDSLTDNGKLNGIIPFSPISDAGRFSNGPVWAEDVGADFTANGEQVVNLALGGATATGVDYGAAAGPFRLATLAGQVGAFTDIFGLGGVASGSNPLVAVWMGANDLFDILDPAVTTAFNATGVAQAVKANIQAIAALGSQFDDFIVLNLPDLGKTPAYSTLLGDPGGIGAPSLAASALTAEFNAQLALSVDALRSNGLNVTLFDTFALFQDVLNGPLTGDLAAFQGMNLQVPCTISLLDPTNPVCSDPDAFFFADGVHPNRIVHQVIAGQVTLAVSPVPLPAGAPLLLAGIAGFAVLRRRRAA